MSKWCSYFETVFPNTGWIFGWKEKRVLNKSVNRLKWNYVFKAVKKYYVFLRKSKISLEIHWKSSLSICTSIYYCTILIHTVNGIHNLLALYILVTLNWYSITNQKWNQ